MGIAVAVHSYKGGTGKTLISANLAVLLSKMGRKVCLLDYDFRGPSLHILLKTKPKRWLNDYLKGNCTIDEVFTEFPLKGTNGGLSASYADPSPEAMRFMMTKDRKWESKALRRILAAKRKLLQEDKVDYMIFDTSPGMYYSSVNAVAASDVVALVMKYDDFDIEGTKLLIEGITDALGKRTGLVLNRIVCEGCGGPVPDDELQRIRTGITKRLGRPVIGLLPCLWQLQRGGSKELFADSQPDHLFVQTLQGVAERIQELGEGR